MHTRMISRGCPPASCWPAAARRRPGFGDVEQVAGRDADRGRGAGAGGPACRCADGEPHGPYAYFTPRPSGRGRARYVPAALAEVVAPLPAPGGPRSEAVLAEISAINAELLARRELAVAGERRRAGRARAGRGGRGAGHMTICVLGGSSERRAQNHQQPPGTDGADISPPVLDGPRSASTPSRPGASTPWPARQPRWAGHAATSR